KNSPSEGDRPMSSLSREMSALTATVLMSLVTISGTSEGWQNRPHVEDGHMFRESRPSGSKISRPRPPSVYKVVMRQITGGVTAEVGATIWRAQAQGPDIPNRRSGGGPELRHPAPTEQATASSRADPGVMHPVGGGLLGGFFWHRVESTAEFLQDERLR